jgi:hypothetical protein
MSLRANCVCEHGRDGEGREGNRRPRAAANARTASAIAMGAHGAELTHAVARIRYLSHPAARAGDRAMQRPFVYSGERLYSLSDPMMFSTLSVTASSPAAGTVAPCCCTPLPHTRCPRRLRMQSELGFAAAGVTCMADTADKKWSAIGALWLQSGRRSPSRAQTQSFPSACRWCRRPAVACLLRGATEELRCAWRLPRWSGSTAC